MTEICLIYIKWYFKKLARVLWWHLFVCSDKMNEFLKNSKLLKFYSNNDAWEQQIILVYKIKDSS